LDAYPGKKLNAVIERIHPRIEWNSRTRIIEARITDKIKLIPRMFARISVQGKKFDNAILVPDSAIITTPRGYHVVFTMEKGRAKMKKVEIGIEKGSLVQIISGLNEGDVVITAGNLDLKDGAPVKVVKKPKHSAGKKLKNENN
jgi:membrane fusion protein (multidrug efflux system)